MSEIDISVKTLTGLTFELHLHQSSTIAEVKHRIQQERNYNPEDQRLIYAGKQLKDEMSLDYYNIQNGSTLSIVIRSSPSTARNRSRGSNDRVWELARVAEDNDKPAQITRETATHVFQDNYIVHAENHSLALDFVQKSTIDGSEFQRRQGLYNVANVYDDYMPTIASAPFFGNHILTYIHSIRSRRVKQSNNTMLDSTADRVDIFNIAMKSIAHTYCVFVGVMQRCEIMVRQGFSTTFYSFLIRKDQTTAELLQIHHTDILFCVQSLDKHIRDLEDLVSTLETTAIFLETTLIPRFSFFLPILNSFTAFASLKNQTKTYTTLLACNVLAVLLELCLISYVGGHFTKMDMHGMDNEEKIIKINHQNLGVLCTLRRRRLACMDKFLQQEPVWILSIDKNHDYYGNLSLLTSKELFADVWGPVWAVPSTDIPQHDSGKPALKQYNVSKGVIYRLPGASSHTDKVCHFFCRSELENYTAIQSLPMYPDDILLIGNHDTSPLHVGTDCRKTYSGFEEAFGDKMEDIGTHKPSWILDSRSFSLGFSYKIAGIGMSFGQKRLPGRTKKQNIWDEWIANPPVHTNYALLYQYLVVEVSHCTGNARRIRFKDLFIKSPLRNLLGTRFPQWTEQPWARTFLKALTADSSEALSVFWQTEADSNEAKKLISTAFKILDKTGTDGANFAVAYFNGPRELTLPLECKWNSWANMLRDSSYVTTYALIGDSCLAAKSSIISKCDNTLVTALTAMQTTVAIPYIPRFDDEDKLWIYGAEPPSYLQDVTTADDQAFILVWKSGSMLKRPPKSASLGREVCDATSRWGNMYRVLVRSDRPSFKGMDPETRDRQILRSHCPLQHPGGTTERDNWDDVFPIRRLRLVRRDLQAQRSMDIGTPSTNAAVPMPWETEEVIDTTRVRNTFPNDD